MTLVEILLAISLTAITLAVGMGVLDGAVVAERSIVRESRARDAQVGGLAQLRGFLARLSDTPGSVPRFEADSRQISFATTCVGAAAELERCDLRLRIVAVPGGAVLHAEWTRGRVELVAGTTQMQFGFREMLSDGPVWSSVWGSTVRRPEAVGLIDGSDTLLLPVGAGR